jgi:glycosyltransferase involved in cell wall biosynthesis
MRVALIHYWLVTWRGGEQVLRAIANLFPEADIYTHVADPELVARELPGRNVATTFISRLPFARRSYQKYLSLMPLALEQLDLRRYDLVISSEAGPAKGVIVPPHAQHICYCHSPMRYAWDRYHDYRAHAGWLTRAVMAPAMHYVRMWDQLSAQRVDQFIANSQFVSTRIRKYYGRDSEVIHPPVPVHKFDASRESEDFYLWVGQLVPYKRPDLMVEAFNMLGRPLVVIGDGPMLTRLKRMAKPHIRLLGKQSFEVIVDHYARCRALVFPGVEDFGIVPVEAMASGKPVVAFDYGGARETVKDGVTGLLFHEQTANSLAEAVRSFESHHGFDPRVIRAHAERFSEEVFENKFRSLVARVIPSSTESAAIRGMPKTGTYGMKRLSGIAD